MDHRDELIALVLAGLLIALIGAVLSLYLLG